MAGTATPEDKTPCVEARITRAVAGAFALITIPTVITVPVASTLSTPKVMPSAGSATIAVVFCKLVPRIVKVVNVVPCLPTLGVTESKAGNAVAIQKLLAEGLPKLTTPAVAFSKKLSLIVAVLVAEPAAIKPFRSNELILPASLPKNVNLS